jgi:sugar lactone lactonase YvrE
MSSSVPELVLSVHPRLGEGPVWDVRRGLLWWVDILGGIVHAFDPRSDNDRRVEAGQMVGAVVLRRDGSLFLLGERAVLTLEPSTGSLSTVLEFPLETPVRRCNDAKADPAGRVWFGRLAIDHTRGAASLCRLDSDLSATTVIDNISIPNGLDWTADGATLYFAESLSRTLTAYDFDVASGRLGDARQLPWPGPEIGLPEGAVPDGFILDSEGCIWLATWDGRCVLRLAPDGAVLDRIELPVGQVSSCAFGGPDLEDLYIATGREDFGLEDDAREPNAGGLFRVRPGVRGVPPRLAF